MDRDAAYAVVQQNAMEAWEKREKSFRELIENDERVTEKLSADEIAVCFDARRQLLHVDTIFSRVGLS